MNYDHFNMEVEIEYGKSDAYAGDGRKETDVIITRITIGGHDMPVELVPDSLIDDMVARVRD